MKKQKGLVLPMVMVMMVLSQLLYMSLLVYNQGQARRYINFQDHYIASIQLRITKPYYELENIADFVDPTISRHIQSQSQFLLSAYEVKEILIQANQYQVLSLERKDGRGPTYVGLIYHMPYLDVIDQAQAQAYSRAFVIQGKVKQAKSPEDFQDTSLSLTLLEMRDKLSASSYQMTSKTQRGGQGMIELKQDPWPVFSFSNGNQVNRTKLNAQSVIQVSDQEGHLITQEKVEDQGLFYFVRSTLELYSPDQITHE